MPDLQKSDNKRGKAFASRSGGKFFAAKFSHFIGFYSKRGITSFFPAPHSDGDSDNDDELPFNMAFDLSTMDPMRRAMCQIYIFQDATDGVDGERQA